LSLGIFTFSFLTSIVGALISTLGALIFIFDEVALLSFVFSLFPFISTFGVLTFILDLSNSGMEPFIFNSVVMIFSFIMKLFYLIIINFVNL